MADAAERHNNVVELPSEFPRRIPGGNYQLAFNYFEVRPIFKNVPKLILWFRVVDAEYMGADVPAYYHLNPKRKQGRGKGAPFSVGMKSEFLRQYVQLFDEVPPRPDRIPMTRFDNKVIKARVRLVQKNMRQRVIPPKLQYNVVDELLQVVR